MLPLVVEDKGLFYGFECISHGSLLKISQYSCIRKSFNCIHFYSCDEKHLVCSITSVCVTVVSGICHVADSWLKDNNENKTSNKILPLQMYKPFFSSTNNSKSWGQTDSTLIDAG